MVSLAFPALVRICYLREHKLETLPGGNENVLYRFPDGRQLSNWELIRTPQYEAFKRGFRDGFEGRVAAGETIELPLRGEYQSGFQHGGEERKKQLGRTGD
ncbi:MAG: hypothetical protein M3O85_05910 [Acidobacteriota bacterium]|nr:hypothetical protein [Acidobacteriota bacterium]